MNETHLHTSAAPHQTATSSEPGVDGLKVARRFSHEGVSPYDEVQWEKRTALITDNKGNTIFEQKDVEVPLDWSMTATNIVASKYLHGQLGTPERETGVRQLVELAFGVVRGDSDPDPAWRAISPGSVRDRLVVWIGARRRWQRLTINAGGNFENASAGPSSTARRLYHSKSCEILPARSFAQRSGLK